jgi:hypothetical protein
MLNPGIGRIQIGEDRVHDKRVYWVRNLGLRLTT